MKRYTDIHAEGEKSFRAAVKQERQSISSADRWIMDLMQKGMTESESVNFVHETINNTLSGAIDKTK